MSSTFRCRYNFAFAVFQHGFNYEFFACADFFPMALSYYSFRAYLSSVDCSGSSGLLIRALEVSVLYILASAFPTLNHTVVIGVFAPQRSKLETSPANDPRYEAFSSPQKKNIFSQESL